MLAVMNPLHEWHHCDSIMSEDYFSFDDYEPRHENPAKYVDTGDTPLDYKKSTKDGAIDHRQKNKGNKSRVKDGGDTVKQVQHGEKETKTAEQNIREDKHGEVISLKQHEREQNSDDPANW